MIEFGNQKIWPDAHLIKQGGEGRLKSAETEPGCFLNVVFYTLLHLSRSQQRFESHLNGLSADCLSFCDLDTRSNRFYTDSTDIEFTRSLSSLFCGSTTCDAVDPPLRTGRFLGGLLKLFEGSE